MKASEFGVDTNIWTTVEGDRKYSYNLNLLNGPLVRWDKSEEGFFGYKKLYYDTVWEREHLLAIDGKLAHGT